MSFSLYNVLDGVAHVFVRNVELAGSDGPFHEAHAAALDIPEWELSEKQLVQRLGAKYGLAPANHAVIIDLKPSHKTEASLFRLKYVWGYTEGFTPLALELEALHDEKPPAGTTPAEFKQGFWLADNYVGDRIYEFLYLQKNWAPGKVGYVNGALLYEHAFDSFLKRINRKRRDDDRLPPLGFID